MRIINKIIISVVLFAICFSFSTVVYANENQDYVFNVQKGEAVAVPSSMMQTHIIDSVGNIPLNSPQDIVACNQKLFVLDSLNSRVIIFDSQYNEVFTFASVNKSGEQLTFKDAQGIFATEDNRIYIADTENNRILISDFKGNYIKEFKDTEDVKKLSSKFVFKPQKIVVDNSKRMFIINQGTYEGLLCISADGEFEGFIGANKVIPTLWELFWKTFSTKAQQEAMVQFVPVEFSGVAIDRDGFLYSTAKGENGNQMIRKFNMNGVDILRFDKSNPLQGDLEEIVAASSDKKKSNFIDVALRVSGVYTCLDNTRGRLFTYNHNGELLFAMGGLSNQKGSFSNPGAVEWFGDELVVADRGTNKIVIFSPTDYGKILLCGVDNQFAGNYNEATEDYYILNKYNSNSEIAYKGIAKSLFKEGKYKEAMVYAQLGNDTDLYSKAFDMQRQSFMAQVIPILLIVIIAVAVVSVIFSSVKTIKRIKRKYED